MNIWGNKVPGGERASVKSRGRSKLEAYLEVARMRVRGNEGRWVVDEAEEVGRSGSYKALKTISYYYTWKYNEGLA